MKKRILGIALVVAMLASLLLGSTVLAADPIVSINVFSPGNGDVTVTTTGTDSSGFHPGEVGEVNTFIASGAFTASYDSYAGNYGSLRTYVNASTTTGASFWLRDTFDFHILSANNPVSTVGTFTAIAEGTTANMNLKTVGSMYVWSEATNPWSQPGLSGTHIAKQLDMNTGGPLTATMLVEVNAVNGASISNSNIWGLGADKNGGITTNYSGGARSITANGSGTYQQYISAGTNATSNTTAVVDGNPVNVTTTLPAGGAINTILNFLGSMSSTYSMNGK